MWGAGGSDYDGVSYRISGALAHAAQRLNAKPGEKILDVATGTGWSARNVARGGAQVTAVDISTELLAAARALSAHVRPPIEFRQADAELLPFEDGSFDRVISTFGVMFAFDHARAAAELARVCRRGGRLVLATWAPDGSVAELFGIVGKYRERPAGAGSPIAWGDPRHVEALLGDAFELKFEPGVAHAYHEDVEAIWAAFSRGFGPIRQLVETLDAALLASLRRDLDAYHGRFMTPAGLHVTREYLVVIGRRR